MLLQVDEIANRTNERMRIAGFASPPDVFQPSNLTGEKIDQLQQILGVKFPEPFRRLMCTYNFGELSIGGVGFGVRGDYGEFLKTYNEAGGIPYPWWGDGSRPQEKLMVASTDAYVVVLQTTVGNVEAHLHHESWRASRTIASDFELFVRAAGTLALLEEARQRELASSDISRSVGCDPASTFWKQY